MGLEVSPLRHYFLPAEDKWRTLLSLLAATAVCLLISLYCWKKRRLWYLASKIPGPTPLPIIGNLLLFAIGSLAECFKIINQVTEKYGPVVRLWGGGKLVVLITDAESIEKVMTNKKLGNRGRYIYEVGRPIFNNGLFLSCGNTWRSHRKIINSSFHANVLDGFIHQFSRLSLLLSDNIKKVSDGSTFDLYNYSFLCSMDIVTETTMGEVINVQVSHDNYFTRAIIWGLEIIIERFRKPWMLYDWIYYLTQAGKETKLVMKDVNDKIFDGIEKRKCKFNAGDKQKTDLDDKESLSKKELCLLDLMIENGAMSMEEIRDEVVTILSAGSETTATTFCYALSLLGIHQEVQDRVLEEQKLIFGQDHYRSVCREDLSQMNYLEQVIKETLRLFPSVPFIFRNVSEDIEVGMGYTIPAGSYCVINAYFTHRNPKYYPNPRSFDPERFSVDNSIGRHPYVYIPFGGGRRLCVGYRYAMLELKTMLSTLLRRFRVVRTPGGMKELEDNLEAGLVIKPGRGFPIQMLPRNL